MSERKSCHRPRCSDDEMEILRQYRGIKQECDEVDIDVKDCKHGWLKNNNASLFFKNPEFQEPDFNPKEIDWDSILADVKQIRTIPKSSENGDELFLAYKFDRLVFTDVHIGMKILADSLYGGEWNKDIVMKYLRMMIYFVIDNRTSDTIIVDDLGDFMDGFGGKTVRKQHDLPQNMTDHEAFDCGLAFKILLAKELSAEYKHVIFHNVCNDNHSGAFGYTVNSAFKTVCEKVFDNVQVDNYKKFINHYKIGNNVFILCHGKDGANLKFGFAPHINDKALDKINHYIDFHYLRQPEVRVEFSKGDSHVELIDKAKPNRFEYWNYPAFCPASDWVQTNYTPKNNGFYFFNYFDTNDYRMLPYFFNGR